MSETKFDAALPVPFDYNWKAAERPDPENLRSNPRFTSYQAPESSDEHIFMQESFSFKGGQSVDTAEYPFGGLWSNDRLNEKPQVLHIQGFIHQTHSTDNVGYIKKRNAFVEALRIPTDDDAPGFLSLPFWGRFPVVVADYEIGEKFDEKGRCSVSLDLKRAGVSPDQRAAKFTSISAAAAKASAKTALQAAVKKDFVAKMSKITLDAAFLRSALGKVKTAILSIVGRIQGAMTLLNTITNEINSISRLVADALLLPGKAADTLINCWNSIVAGIAEIKNAGEALVDLFDGGNSSGSSDGGSGDGSGGGAASASASGGSSYPAPEHNNRKNVLLMLFAASDYTLDTPAATVAQDAIKQAAENLYRACCYCAACELLSEVDVTYQSAAGFWTLLQQLAGSIDVEDPEVYAAVENMLIATSRELAEKELSAELTRKFDNPSTLLYMAQYLGCDEAILRKLNSISDSFIIQGDVVYV